MSAKYPPRRENKEYVAKWNEFLPHLMKRRNFNTTHLFQLDVLCGLFAEYEKIQQVIDLAGHTYQYLTVAGAKSLLNPEVAQLNVIRRQIAEYIRMLGLTLVKPDAPVKGEKTDEEMNEEDPWK